MTRTLLAFLLVFLGVAASAAPPQPFPYPPGDGVAPRNLYSPIVKCDVQVFASVSGSMTAGSNVFTRSDGGSFTSADIGKVVWFPGAKAGGDTLVSAISGFTDANHVTLAVSADLSTSGKYHVVRVDEHFPGSVPVADPADGDGVVGHNYAPGDQIVLSATAPDVGATLVVAHTQLGGNGTLYTIVNAGSGGTNGKGYVSGTTGEGYPFELWVTVSGGAIASIDGIKRVGLYNINPANPSAEPVLGMNLTGAILGVSMGITDAYVLKQGSYATAAGMGTLTNSYGYLVGQASTTGTGVGAQFYAMTGIAAADSTYGAWGYGTDDTAAIQAAISTVGASTAGTNAPGGGTVVLPRGNCAITSTLNVQQNNVLIRGAGAGSPRAGASFLSNYVGIAPAGNAGVSATTLVWFGPRGGTMYHSEALNGTYAIHGGGLWDLTLAGLNSAGIDVLQVSHSNATWVATMENSLVALMDTEETKNSTSNPRDVTCTQENQYDRLLGQTIYSRAAWNSWGWIIRGSVMCDFSANRGKLIQFNTGLQVPFDIGNSDSNSFDQLFAWAVSAYVRCAFYHRANLWQDGSGNTTLGDAARSLFIGLRVCPGRQDYGGDYAETGARRIFIGDLDVQGNNTVTPTVEPGAQLTWHAAPQSAPGAQVQPSNDEINCNGNGEIDQANEGAAVSTLNAQSVDCWKHFSSGPTHTYIAAQQKSNASNLTAEFADTYIRLTTTTTETPAATDRRFFCTTIDAADMRSLGFGSTQLPDRPYGSPHTINLSFMMRASVPGAWSFDLRSPNNNRHWDGQAILTGSAVQHQTITASSLAAGGVAYAAGETIQLGSGKPDVAGEYAFIQVDTVDPSTGAIVTYHFTNFGDFPPTGLPSATSGLFDAGTSIGRSLGIVGSGATLSLTFGNDSGGTMTTWQNFSFSIPPDADVSGGVVQTDWPKTPGTVGALLCFDTGSGSARSANSFALQWAGGTEVLPRSNSLVTLTGGTLDITQLRIWVGQNGNAPYAPRPFAEELMLAQHRYRKTFPAGTAPAQSAGVAGAMCSYAGIAAMRPSITWRFDPPMAASPTITTYNPSAANANWRIASGTDAGSDIAVSVDPSTAVSAGGVEIAGTTSMATIGDNACIHATADARF